MSCSEVVVPDHRASPSPAVGPSSVSLSARGFRMSPRVAVPTPVCVCVCGSLGTRRPLTTLDEGHRVVCGDVRALGCARGQSSPPAPDRGWAWGRLTVLLTRMSSRTSWLWTWLLLRRNRARCVVCLRLTLYVDPASWGVRGAPSGPPPRKGCVGLCPAASQLSLFLPLSVPSGCLGSWAHSSPASGARHALAGPSEDGLGQRDAPGVLVAVPKRFSEKAVPPGLFPHTCIIVRKYQSFTMLPPVYGRKALSLRLCWHVRDYP